MPECVLGAKNEQNITNHERQLVDLRLDMERVKNRLPNWAVFYLSGLSAACGSLLTILLSGKL